MSFSALVIEISYTRVISYKLFYYYVYLVIGMALLGTGTGGVLVAVSKRLKAAATDKIVFWSLIISSVFTVGAFMAVAFLHIDTLSVWEYGTAGSNHAFLVLFTICLGIFGSFVGPGVIVATLFGRQPEGIGSLYFADLFGAGIGCAVVIYFVATLGAPAAVMIAALAMAAGAAFVSLRLGYGFRAMATVALAGTIFLVTDSGILPYVRLDSSKSVLTPANTAYSGWGSIFRVDAVKYPGIPNLIGLDHDGIIGSGIYRWNDKRSFLKVYDFPKDPRAIPFDVLKTPPNQEAIIGAAGGHEVLTSIYYQARHIDAVELNPVTVNLVEHVYANFDGHLAQYPSVTYYTADGRSFMARTKKHYQLIWYPAPDSYSATNGALASAYVLSESYLYTTNGIESMLSHLTKGGIFVAQFGETDDQYDLRTARFVATVRQVLSDMGIKNATDHIMVSATLEHFLGIVPMSTIVVSLQPFSPARIARFEASLNAVPQTSALYVPDAVPVKGNSVNELMRTSNAKLSHFYATFPFNITPTTDNDPFFWHFARFGTVLKNYTHSIDSADRENQVGERVLVMLLGLSILIALIFLLLPFLKIRHAFAEMPRKTASGLFFAGIGFGFIFFEITLMQLLNLFLGYPTYALTVVLMSLLVFTGLGALLSQRIGRPRQAVPILFLVLAALFVFYLAGLTPLTNALLDLPLAARVVISFLVVAPLGLCLGMFMPFGLGQVSAMTTYSREYVAWGWAVNGFVSVVGSALATILAMSYGFDVVLFWGLMAYLVALAAWFRLSRPVGGQRRPAHSAVAGRAAS